MSRRVDPIKPVAPQATSSIKSVVTSPKGLLEGKNKFKVAAIVLIGVVALMFLVRTLRNRKKAVATVAAPEVEEAAAPQWKTSNPEPRPRPHHVHHQPMQQPVHQPVMQPVPQPVPQRVPHTRPGVVMRPDPRDVASPPADNMGSNVSNFRPAMTRPEKEEQENELPPGDINVQQVSEESLPPPSNTPVPPIAGGGGVGVPGDFNPI